MDPDTEAIAQIEAVLSLHRGKRARSNYDDLSDLDDSSVSSLLTLMCDTIRRFAPRDSQYVESTNALLTKFSPASSYIVPHVAGILAALKHAYEAGFLTRYAELIHADVFSDFIDMAEYLLGEGYKDPAAVIIGSVLEQHLRQLCSKHGIPVENAGKPKKADQLNADLATANVYSKLDQKSITSWLDLRNKAAHGRYGEYTKEQALLFLHSVRDFMVRVAA